MAAGDKTQGTRVEIQDGYHVLKRGEYGKAADGIWYARAPGGQLGNLSAHEVTAHPDGTISVQPSIQIDARTVERSWHGYLEHGVWREV